ncbi:MAG: ribbon-helix-helix domain-containing protein [Acidilobaceae archaeon]
MASRRRFGISIREDLAERLDKLCLRLSMERSRLVEQAISRYLDELEHYSSSHYCVSLLVVSCIGDALRLREVVQRYSERVLLDIHSHEESYCRVVFVIEGSAENILAIYRHALDNEECRTTLVSLH